MPGKGAARRTLSAEWPEVGTELGVREALFFGNVPAEMRKPPMQYAHLRRDARFGNLTEGKKYEKRSYTSTGAWATCEGAQREGGAQHEGEVERAKSDLLVIHKDKSRKIVNGIDARTQKN